MPLAELIGSLSANPYFGAGAGLFGLGIGATILRRSVVIGQLLFRRKFLISLEVSNEDRCYEWLLQWINRHAKQSTNHLSVKTQYVQSDSGVVQSRFDFMPSVGDHFFRYKGRFIKVERNRETQMVRGQYGGAQGVPFETVKLTTVGWDRSYYEHMLEEARQLAVEQVQTQTVVYRSVGSEWRPFGHPRRKRPVSSIVLDQNIASSILADCREFIANSQWYAERGIPYRRGYLLYGPPGCGKSSFITALASELDYSISVLSLSEICLTDDRLNHLLNTAPLQSLVLLEDVDAAFVGRGDTGGFPTGVHPSAYDGLTRITFSGLLNALDGVGSGEARLLFMTTNHRHRLDPAMVRPGRVDIQQYIGACTDHQLEWLFRNFYADQYSTKAAASNDGQLFASEVRAVVGKTRSVSPAQVQGMLLLYKNKPKIALSNVASYCWNSDTASSDLDSSDNTSVSVSMS